MPATKGYGASRLFCGVFSVAFSVAPCFPPEIDIHDDAMAGGDAMTFVLSQCGSFLETAIIPLQKMPDTYQSVSLEACVEGDFIPTREEERTHSSEAICRRPGAALRQ